MRTKTTPWNSSYKVDELAKSLRKHRPRGMGRSAAQKSVKLEQQRNFKIHDAPKKPVELPEDWKALGKSRKRAMEQVEDRKLAEELREVWE